MIIIMPWKHFEMYAKSQTIFENWRSIHLFKFNMWHLIFADMNDRLIARICDYNQFSVCLSLVSII